MNRVEIKNFAKEKLSGNLGSIWKILIIALGISLAAGVVFGILFSKMDADFLDSLLGILMMPLGIGTTAFFVSLIENENFEAKDLFKYYHDFVKIIGVTVLMGLIVMLGYICFIIPGIILTLSYSLVPIILIKKPELGIVETLKYSREKMQGHKLDTFVLGLSFIGWAILGTLTFGILYIWLYPYMQLTFTKFYLNILGEE
jgi:integral membrane protein